MVLSGEGADEAFAGYRYYFGEVTNPAALQRESVRILRGLHNMNLQRVDRMTMAHALEGRVPFLDVDFLDMPWGWSRRRSSPLRPSGEVAASPGLRRCPAGRDPLADQAGVRAGGGVGVDGARLLRGAGERRRDGGRGRRVPRRRPDQQRGLSLSACLRALLPRRAVAGHRRAVARRRPRTTQDVNASA